MALKIRLRQQGRRNLAVYRLVLTDVRAPRDGKYKEMLGWYDPNRDQAIIEMKVERVRHWLAQGAILTDKAAALVKQVHPELLDELQIKRMALRTRLCNKRRAARRAHEPAAVNP